MEDSDKKPKEIKIDVSVEVTNDGKLTEHEKEINKRIDNLKISALIFFVDLIFASICFVQVWVIPFFISLFIMIVCLFYISRGFDIMNEADWRRGGWL